MKWKLILGVLLSALFLYLAFRKAQWVEVEKALSGASYWLMVPAVLFTFAAYALRAVRWRYLLLTVKDIAFLPLFSSIMIGFMGNNVLPARLGEFLRAHSIGRSTGVSRSAAMASIVVERIFDMCVLLVLFGIIVLLRGLPEKIRLWGVLLLCLVVPVLGLLVLLQARPNLMLGICRRIPHAALRSRVIRAATHFHEALGVLREGRNIALAFFYSLIMWAFITLVVVCCVHALHLQVPPQASVVVLLAMAVGTMLPLAPGYIGALQIAGVLGLRPYGVEESVALSFTLLYHASQWFPVTLVGLLFFLRERLAIRETIFVADPKVESSDGGAVDGDSV